MTLPIRPQPYFKPIDYQICRVESCFRIALAKVKVKTELGEIEVAVCDHHKKVIEAQRAEQP